MDGDLDSRGLSKEDICHHTVRSPELLSAVGQSDGPVASESQLLSIFLLGHLVCGCVCVCVHANSVVSSSLRPHGQALRPLPGFSVHGILQARILEWGAISFSRGSF